jgi:hypothetical protein
MLTDELRSQLPLFVQHYLAELIRDDCQFEENEWMRQEQEQQLLAKTTYTEVTGTIEHPYTDVNKQVQLWIGNHDEVRLHLYIAGSDCWILPDNHCIFFHPIDPSLLPAKPDRPIWWLISGGYAIYRIQLLRESEVIGKFPDMG